MSTSQLSPKAAESLGLANLEIAPADLEAGLKPPSDPASITGGDARNVQFALSSDPEKDTGPANGKTKAGLNINSLPFKRDPPVARGPYYTTQVE
jgi:hypothetical protein